MWSWNLWEATAHVQDEQPIWLYRDFRRKRSRFYPLQRVCILVDLFLIAWKIVIPIWKGSWNNRIKSYSLPIVGNEKNLQHPSPPPFPSLLAIWPLSRLPFPPLPPQWSTFTTHCHRDKDAQIKKNATHEKNAPHRSCRYTATNYDIYTYTALPQWSLLTSVPSRLSRRIFQYMETQHEVLLKLLTTTHFRDHRWWHFSQGILKRVENEWR